MENKSYDGGEEKGKFHNSFHSSDENGHKEEEVSIRMREPTSRMSLNVQQINSSKDELITEQKGNFASRAVVRVRIALLNSLVRHSQKVHLLLTAIACLSVLCYFGAVFWHWDRQGRKPLKWCTGDGFLLVMFIIFCLAITYYKAIKPIFSRRSTSKNESSSSTYSRCIGIFKQLIFYCLVIVLLFYLIYDAFGETHRLISIGGMLAFIFIGFFSSKHPNEIKWRTVLIGIFVQITMGMLTIRWDFGRSVFLCIGNRTETFLRFGYEGAAFAFGNYIVHELHVFAFMSLSVIYFMGMIIEILFYVGWIQRMCFNMGWVIQKILGTTIIESVNSVTTVCLGLSEAPLLYRPYIKDLTKSELHAVMAGGFSTVAGTVFAAYTALGVNPSYLITASIMAAPAGLCFAKLLYPETEVSKTTPKNFVFYKSEERSIIDAACKGALSGINIITGVIATIIASVSLVAFFSSALQWFAALVGVEGFTFQSAASVLAEPSTALDPSPPPTAPMSFVRR
ncbi:hypothetical protein LSTR_LSTR005326 [Laodelphax striatellus]|uniref:Sodium/nucleoside cotransporter n=1 Tax=Laodelphax striatellus TaxID=195883 RepID=A0A482X7V4_LAOST|nr:hypothetical protein LSTR_LSTR005326 [Laodelphax striatellus]